MTRLTKTSRSLLAGLALAAGLFGASSNAQAGDVFWSIGMSQPGIHIGVGNLPAPVIIGAPVVVHPRPVYVPPRVIYAPPRPVYQGHGHWNHPHHHGHRGYHGRGHDRHDHHAHRGNDRGGRGDRGHRH